MNELTIPPLAQRDPNSFEILRVWAAEGEQHVTINSDLNGDARDFGQMLADLAYHGAKLYAIRLSMTEDQSLEKIIEGFKNEFKNPGEITGEIID